MITTKILAKKVTIPIGLILILAGTGYFFGVKNPEAAANLKTQTWEFISTLPADSWNWMSGIMSSIF